MSNIFQHEQKIQLGHSKVWFVQPAQMKSNEQYTIHLGFRKIQSHILFSSRKSIGGAYKVDRKISPSTQFHYASFYSPLCFPPAKILIEFDGSVVMEGNVLYSDSL